MNYQELLLKYFVGDISTEEIKALKSWLAENPENRKLFDKRNELWQATSIHSRQFDVDSAWDELSSGIDLEQKKSKIKLVGNRAYSLMKVAAALAFILVIGTLVILGKARSTLSLLADSRVVVTACHGEKANVRLADSTEVILNSGSGLEYDASFNIKRREVKLSGEAFFNVKTDPSRPFIVRAGNIEIVATGTKFNVLSFAEENRIEATLVEGKITVKPEGKEAMIVNPGEQFVYTKKTGDFTIEKVHTESVTSWKENKLRLMDTPLEEAFRKIARVYNVKFSITDRRLLDLKYTATFIDENIEEVMEMLKVVSPITYDISYRTGITDKNYLQPMVVVAYKKR